MHSTLKAIHSDVSSLAACQHRSISDVKSDLRLMGWLSGGFGRALMGAEARLARNTGPGEAQPSVFFSFLSRLSPLFLRMSVGDGKLALGLIK